MASGKKCSWYGYVNVMQQGSRIVLLNLHIIQRSVGTDKIGNVSPEYTG